MRLANQCMNPTQEFLNEVETGAYYYTDKSGRKNAVISVKSFEKLLEIAKERLSSENELNHTKD
jgi:hypothetical protein